MNQAISVTPGPITAADVSMTSAAAPTLLHVFSTFAVGGPQRRFVQLANHFGSRFHHLIRPMDGRTDAAALLDADASAEIQPLGFRRGNALANIRSARAVLAEVRPDVLVTYNWGATEWAAANYRNPVRHIHIEDGFGPEEANKQLLRRVLFRRLVLNRHSTLVVPSQSLKRIALDVWGLDPHRIRYIPNGIPTARFARNPDPAFSAAFHGKGGVIGTVATLRREKALDRLIAAFALVRAHIPGHLVIVGDGPDRGRLEAFVAERGLRAHVTFTGAIAAPERILRAFDVFAISSDTEQMPLSVLEAMAAGRAVASTDAGDIRTMLAEENRPFVVPRYDVALASMMMALLRDSALRERLGAANQARAAVHFDEAQMCAAYGRLFSGNALH
ncbi:MAG: glycosyltransferase family 4 protein [Rhodospirillaceae bacterium]